MATSLGSPSGVREILSLPDTFDARLGQPLLTANRVLRRQMISTANYASALAGTFAADVNTENVDACHRAANLIAAADFCRNNVAVLTDRGMATSVARIGSSGGGESFSTAADVLKAASAYIDRAVSDLRSVGLYVESALYFTVADIFDEDEDAEALA